MALLQLAVRENGVPVSPGVQETCRRKRHGGASLREKERRLREASTAHSKRAQGLLEQLCAPWGEAKKRQLLKVPLPKMPPPPLGKWELTWGGVKGCSMVLLLWCTKGGLKFMTWLAPMPPSHVATSCGKGV